MVLVRRQRSTFSAAFSSLRVISLRKILFDLSAIIGIRTWHRYPPPARGQKVKSYVVTQLIAYREAASAGIQSYSVAKNQHFAPSGKTMN